MSLDGGPRCASVTALEDTTCAVVRREAVKRYIAEQPDFAFHLLSVVIDRARRATESARDIAFLDVYERVTRFFAKEAVARDGGARALPRPDPPGDRGPHRLGAARWWAA
jgi:CRP/FNR family cyclic AMP-dependent transcriptional regulator